jgi:hypothetical protein
MYIFNLLKKIKTMASMNGGDEIDELNFDGSDLN